MHLQIYLCKPALQGHLRYIDESERYKFLKIKKKDSKKVDVNRIQHLAILDFVVELNFENNIYHLGTIFRLLKMAEFGNSVNRSVEVQGERERERWLFC